MKLLRSLLLCLQCAIISAGLSVANWTSPYSDLIIAPEVYGGQRILAPLPLPAYDEDTIVNLMTEIFIAVRRLGGLPDEHKTFPDGSTALWGLRWAPAEGHKLKLLLVPNNVKIDPRVISLMKHLPIYNGGDNEVAPWMMPMWYPGARDLLRSRFIDRQNMDFGDDDLMVGKGYPCEPTVLILMDIWESDGYIVVLDVADNTIRHFGHTFWELDDEYTRTEKDRQKVMNYENRYINWPKHHAPACLQGMLNHYHNGSWLPMAPVGMIEQLMDDADSQEIRRILLEAYGWPGADFREEAWKKDSPTIIDCYLRPEDSDCDDDERPNRECACEQISVKHQAVQAGRGAI